MRMLSLRTLGAVDLRDHADREVTALLCQPKRLALLIYLVAATPSGAHSRDRLLGLFWPEFDEDRARDALTQALRFLRLTLGADALVRRGTDVVAIDTSIVHCDVVAFRQRVEAGQPEEAMRLYGGDFLAGFFVDDAP